ncbi:hypothetical protein FSARC_6844 [Fusarium sarcochroum]|uniref:AB hydrolase-1 domain-containing protein n=1 Tax=Fusarium sarcochroum TaxID=1208366 RepID=A0A8H4TWU0_9HYPO|nr:hypothetical protein FSARC_6844 [Fusarium sarcochroum]
MPSAKNLSAGLVQVSTTPNISLFYCVNGPLDGSKPIILLSSSLAANIHLWDYFVPAFNDKYTIIRYDARFHGKSPQASEPDYNYSKGHTIEELTDDVLKILDHLEIERVQAFVGLSIGAAVGLILGAKHPERVEKVAVVGTRATSNPESNTNHTTRIRFGYENGLLALGRQSISRWFDKEWLEADPERTAFIEDIYAKQSVQGYEASIAALRPLNLFPYVEDIGRRGDGARFVFIAGELDGTVPRESQELGEISGSKVIVIPGSHHITPLQMPEVFHKTVTEEIR